MYHKLYLRNTYIQENEHKPQEAL